MRVSLAKSLLLLCGMVASTTSITAQYWENALPPSPLYEARICFNDTVHDWLVAGGGYDGSPYYIPLYRYDGFSWDTLGLFGNVVNAAVLYHDTLVVAGGFEWMQQDTIKRIACYAGGQWHPYGDINSGIESATIKGLRVLDGELYALGVFKYADGQLCNGIAKRVGGHWEPLPNWPTYFMGDPYVYDIARFQGRLVVGGNYNSQDLTIRDLLQYDGNAWVPVCGSCLHGGMDGVAALAVYQGYLYVGGRFYYSGGNAGQGLMRWDGETWESVGPVGDGVQLDNYSDTYPPSIYSFQQRNGRLFFNGELGFVNHIPTPGLASWDGTDFCALGGANYINAHVAYSFGVYHDSLYLAPSGGVAMLNLVRYLSTDFTYQCSALGLEEVAATRAEFQAIWNAAGQLTLRGLAEGLHSVRVFDAQGRLVLDRSVHSSGGRTEAIPLANASSAVYFVVADHNLGTRTISEP